MLLDSSWAAAGHFGAKQSMLLGYGCSEDLGIQHQPESLMIPLVPSSTKDGRKNGLSMSMYLSERIGKWKNVAY